MKVGVREGNAEVNGPRECTKKEQIWGSLDRSETSVRAESSNCLHEDGELGIVEGLRQG